MRERGDTVGPAWLLPREGWVLVGLGVLVTALFLLTSSVVGCHRREQAARGREWFERGEESLRGGRGQEALEALRTALVYDRENRRYHFRLAQALLAAGRADEARAYLLGLHEEEPGSGSVNLELARMESRRGRPGEAARYYRAALQGTWDGDPLARRLATRFELAELLVEVGASAEAQSELIALSADLPPHDLPGRTRLAGLYLAANEPARAFQAFRAVLRREPGSVDALLGAGQAAFASGEWSRAVSYLRAAVRAGGGQKATEALATAEAVVAADPLRPRLAGTERARRAAQALGTARRHLESCRPAGEAGELDELRSRLDGVDLARAERDMRRDPARIEPAMELVFEAERRVASRCRAPTGPEGALLILANEAEEQR